MTNFSKNRNRVPYIHTNVGVARFGYAVRNASLVYVCATPDPKFDLELPRALGYFRIRSESNHSEFKSDCSRYQLCSRNSPSGTQVSTSLHINRPVHLNVGSKPFVDSTLYSIVPNCSELTFFVHASRKLLSWGKLVRFFRTDLSDVSVRLRLCWGAAEAKEM